MSAMSPADMSNQELYEWSVAEMARGERRNAEVVEPGDAFAGELGAADAVPVAGLKARRREPGPGRTRARRQRGP